MSSNDQIFLPDLPEELNPSGFEVTYIVDVINNVSKKIILNNLPVPVSVQNQLNQLALDLTTLDNTTQTALNGKQDTLTNNSIQDSWLSSNVTLKGNTFNGANQLVQLDANAKLPAVDGSNLTNLPIPPIPPNPFISAFAGM